MECFEGSYLANNAKQRLPCSFRFPVRGDPGTEAYQASTNKLYVKQPRHP